MSVEEKTQHCLQLLLLRLFDLELRVLEMRTPLFSPDERQQLEAVHNAAMDEDGELALQQYFNGLRRQAGRVETNHLATSPAPRLLTYGRHCTTQISERPMPNSLSRNGGNSGTCYKAIAKDGLAIVRTPGDA